MKLNKKRTMYIGLAFFGILLVWQLYGTYCSPMLSFLFVRQEYPEKLAQFTQAFPSTQPTTIELLKNGYITSEEFLTVQWRVGIVMALDNIAALFIMPIFGSLSDKTKSKLGKRMPYILVGSVVTAIALPFIPLFFHNGTSNVGATLVGAITGMIATMCVVIVFMMSYRSPAVALMPDFTPKPLRSKANGIINIVGYVGGAVGSIFGIVIPVTKYIDNSNKSLWMLEIPFITCSIILLFSLAMLLIKIKENELHKQLDKEIIASDKLGESAESVTNPNEKMSKTNRRNLALILIAEAFWFMSLNAIETFQTNYVMFRFNCSSSGGAIMTVVSGGASVCGFIIAGRIADKIGRKWTIFTGICIVALMYLCYCFIPEVKVNVLDFKGKFPFIFFILLPIIGVATSLIHICSFPLVTDYCTSDKLGRFTSLYYTASMLAQSVTPILIGFIFKKTMNWNALPIYSCVLMIISGVVFYFVKAPHHNDKGNNVKGLEALGMDD